MKSINRKELVLMVMFAYIFSLAVRYIYIYQQGGSPEFLHNGSYILSTNDGYFFGSGVQKVLYGMHEFNNLVPNLFDRGLTFLTTILVKILPFSLETIMFYLPAFVSSLIVIPIILIGNLYKEPLWGLFSALISAIVWSYYNRTMLGYYDTDMFSIMSLMFILYFLLKSIKTNSLNTIYITSLLIIFYPFFYLPGRIVLYALIVFYSMYLLYDKKVNIFALKSISLLMLSAVPINIIPAPWNYITLVAIVAALYILFSKKELKKRVLIYLSVAIFLLLLIEGNLLYAIVSKVRTYLHTGVDTHGLKFYGVFQTIAEAKGIPFFANPDLNSVANRTTGSSVAFIISLIGYIYLVYKRREFIILLPLLAIGIFSHWGGLRFTIYGSPALVLGFVYLICNLSKEFIKDKKLQIASVTILTMLALYSNISHTLKYNRAIRPVLKNSEIKQLEHIKKVSTPKDYTLSWWDYGYPIWFYTNTNTLTDGGKHRHDNFVISSMLLSTSPIQTANLARVAVEKYAEASSSYEKWKDSGSKEDAIAKEFKFININNDIYHAGSPYQPVMNILLKNGQKEQKDPNEFMASLDNTSYKLPPKTRDIYLYMPIKSHRIFPVIIQFANLNLATGKKLRDVVFYSGYTKRVKNGILYLSNNIKVNTKDGATNVGDGKLNRIIVLKHKKNGKIDIASLTYHNRDSNLNLLYLKTIGVGIVLDNKTLNSNYVKMFLLGMYDKNLFELVDSSAYGRVYKIKK